MIFKRLASNHDLEHLNMKKPTLSGNKLSQKAFKRIWSIYNDGRTEPSRLDETWYIVNAEFINELKRVVEAGEVGDLLLQDDPNGAYQDGNFFVHNKHLLEYPELESGEKPDKFSRLRKAQGLGIEYHVCDEAVWTEITRTFNYDVAIPRCVFRNRHNKLRIEIQPMEIYVFKPLTVPSDLKTLKFENMSRIRFVISKTVQVKEFLAMVNAECEFSASKKVDFYYGEYASQKDGGFVSGLRLLTESEITSTVAIGETFLDEDFCILAIESPSNTKDAFEVDATAFRGIQGEGRLTELSVEVKSEPTKDTQARNYSNPFFRWMGGHVASPTPSPDRPRRGVFGFFSSNSNGSPSYILNGLEGHANSTSHDSIGFDEASLEALFDKGGMVGLINLGNTCFINSALQCLSKVFPLSRYFLRGEFAKDINKSNPLGTGGRLAMAYYKTLVHLWGKPNVTYSPRELKHAIGEKREEFLGYQQQDSQELLAFLLDGLHEDLNRIKKRFYFPDKLEVTDESLLLEIAESSWNRHKQLNNSIIVDLFQGQYKSRLRCPQCSKISITFDPFMTLSLPIRTQGKQLLRVYFLLDASAAVTARLMVTVPRLASVAMIKSIIRDRFVSLYNCGNSSRFAYYTSSKSSVKNGMADILSRLNLSDIDGLSIDNILIISSTAIRRHYAGSKMMLTVSNATRLSDHQLPPNLHVVAPTITLFAYLLEPSVVRGYEGLDSLQEAFSLSMTDENNTPNDSSELSDGSYSYQTKSFSDEEDEASQGSSALSTLNRLPDTEDPTLGVLLVFILKEHAKHTLQDNYLPFLIRVPFSTTCQEFYRLFSDYLSVIYASMEKDSLSSRAPVEDISSLFRLFELEHRPTTPQLSTPSFAEIMLPNDSTPLTRFLSFRNNLASLCISTKLCPNIIDVTRPSDSQLDAVVTLEECLDLFSEEEQLDKYNLWYCSACKKHVKAFKKLDLWELPQILILHLKRFSKSIGYCRSKITNLISFPHGVDEYLDMSSFVYSETGRGKFVEPGHRKPLKYELIGVNCHSGGLGSGHYFAFTKGKDGSWVEYSDSDVAKTSAGRVQSRDAYLLFYKLVKP